MNKIPKEATFYENWSEELKSASFKTVEIELTPEEISLLVKVTEARLNGRPLEAQFSNFIKVHSELFHERLKELMEPFKETGCYPKLGSRGPKDSFVGHKKGFKCTTAKEVVELLVDSERIWEDLSNGVTRTLLLREWMPIRIQDEYRCLAYEGRFIGISQYDYYKYFPEYQNKQYQIYVVTQAKTMYDQLKPHMPKTVVFDLWLDYIGEYQKMAGVGRTRRKLIEVNPYAGFDGFGTDPCCFTWQEIKELEKENNNPERPIFKFVEKPIKLKNQNWKDLIE